MVLALRICLLVLLAVNSCVEGRSSAGGIVRYQSGASSRSEEGTPGRRVTGEWSWVDATGKKHRVWYVADEGGFRAFGDVMPREPTTLRVGTPVIGASALPTEHRESPPTSSHSYSATFGPLKGTIGSQSVPLPSLHAPSPETSPLRKPAGMPSTSSVPTEKVAMQNPSTQTSQDILADTSKLLKFQQQQQQQQQQPVTKESSRLQIVPRLGKSFTNFRSEESTGDSHESTRRLKPQPVQREGPGLPVFASQREPETPKQSHEDFLKPGVGMAKMVLGDSSERHFINLPVTTPPPVSVGLSKNIDFLQPQFPTLEMPRRIQGTEFVLVEKMQVPNLPKERIMVIDRLQPKPVVVSGPPPPIISGIHTSGRPIPLDDRSNELPVIRPAGIDLVALGLRTEPVIDRDGTDPNGPVPQPRKVEGAINLTNFLSPFLDKARATPPPFDFDYYYYDYYDYIEENNNNSRGPSQSKNLNNQKKSQSKDSDESVDFDDSGEE